MKEFSVFLHFRYVLARVCNGQESFCQLEDTTKDCSRLLETTGDYFYLRMLEITEDYWRQLDAVTSFLTEDNDTRWPSIPS